MPIDSLDPHTALIVIDLQEGLVKLPTIHPLHDIAKSAGLLAHAFRDAGLPVILVTVEGLGSTELLPELDRQDKDHVVTKLHRSAFQDDTGLAGHLRARGITEVVVIGVATSRGVEATVVDARKHGFQVAVATDALTDLTQDAHDKGLNEILRSLGRDGTVAEIIAALSLG